LASCGHRIRYGNTSTWGEQLLPYEFAYVAANACMPRALHHVSMLRGCKCMQTLASTTRWGPIFMLVPSSALFLLTSWEQNAVQVLGRAGVNSYLPVLPKGLLQPLVEVISSVSIVLWLCCNSFCCVCAVACACTVSSLFCCCLSLLLACCDGTAAVTGFTSCCVDSCQESQVGRSRHTRVLLID
jgi:hypothetical protein